MQIVTVFLVSVMEYNFVNKSLGKAATWKCVMKKLKCEHTDEKI